MSFVGQSVVRHIYFLSVKSRVLSIRNLSSSLLLLRIICDPATFEISERSLTGSRSSYFEDRKTAKTKSNVLKISQAAAVATLSLRFIPVNLTRITCRC